MTRKWKIAAAAMAVLAMASFVFQPGQVTAQGKAPPDILKKLEGNWRGKGKMRPYSDSDPEPVTCSASYRFLDKDPKMQLQLHCATVNAKSQLVAFFNYAQSASNLEGRWFQKWSTAQGEENGSFSGKASSSKMNLDVIAAGRKRAEIKVDVNGSRAHSVSVVGLEKGTASQSFTITFNR